jgi:hypothetical protein
MTPQKQQRILTGSCVLGLLALAMMTWSLFDPRPIPVVATMSLGQVIGTLSLGAFAFIVVSDLRARLKEK